MTPGQSTLTASRWDDEYRAGRYAGDPPVEFVDVIGAAVRAHRPQDEIGLYVGCGNGRNYVPLVQKYGLDLVGLDISAVAIEQLRERLPERAHRLIQGGFDRLEPDVRFGTVISIQVFQHGTASEAHTQFATAVELLLPGGLLCVRVNATGTEVEHRYTVIDTNARGGLTVRYDDGPKAGLLVHFFGRDEIEALTANLVTVSPLRRHRSPRLAPRSGYWDQWEGIWSTSISKD